MKTFARLFQMAYVTNDFGRALEHFRDVHGVRRFFEMRNCNSEVAPGCVARLDVALAWAGETQIELIAPLGGDDEFYRSGLPSTEFALRLHHIGQHVDTQAEFEQLLADLRRNDVPIIGQTRSYFYADMGRQFGHHMEYVCPETYGEIERSIAEQIPRN